MSPLLPATPPGWDQRGPAGVLGPDAGVPAEGVERWPMHVTVLGTLVGVVLVVLVLPVMLVLMLLSTLCESLRILARLDAPPAPPDVAEEDFVLVFPGTCTYVFWQLGMVQYLAENFDTRRAKIVGCSSGSLCAGALLRLEQDAAAASPCRQAAAARRAAHAVFSRAHASFTTVATSPCAFACRLSSMLLRILDEILPENVELGDRLRLGVRRARGDYVPALMPQVLDRFPTRGAFIASALASSQVWLITALAPVRWVQGVGLCGDGVNPWSFYGFVDFAVQWAKGLLPRTAPRHTYQGTGIIYAVWNCGVMRHLLPRQGRHLWVTPTVGGHTRVVDAIRMSPFFAAEQWRGGYAHAAALDREGYWEGLPRRGLQVTGEMTDFEGTPGGWRTPRECMH